MARLFASTALIYVTTGTVPQNSLTSIGYNGLEEIFKWLIWTTSIFTTITAYPIFSAITAIIWWFNLLTHVDDVGSTYIPPRSNRGLHRKHFDIGFLTHSYNTHLLILSCYMLHPCAVFQFSNPMIKNTNIHIAKCTEITNKITAPPWKLIYKAFNTRPPTGYIFSTMVFSTAVFATILSFIQLIWKLKWHYPSTKISNKKRTKNKKLKSPIDKRKHRAYFNVTTAFQSKASVEEFVKRHMFNFLAIIFVIDNAANVHIANERTMFHTLRPCTKRCVATIGGTDLVPEGIGTVLVNIKDDEGISSILTLEDVLFFPASPFNLISIACLADQFKDDDNTFIRTARFHSDFTWNFGKHSKTIYHAQSRIPEVEVTTSKGSLKGFATAINYLDPRSHNQV